MGDGPNSSAKWSKYSVGEDGTLTRNAEFCPTCGPGVFLAIHANRKSCGRCGYTVLNDE
ncbi:MAG: 30S ribosomal protein S27ae [Candidatus Poseidoniaceae archaeon]|nr:30S ribosomal protein S27ae [Euryarchaeota archaeon]MBL6890788.1 30S ribosomal protein S27ae [Candidatus Poseidoniaceae archaeon]RAH07692.1 MAG: 30S ribosomal protein S27ae [Euryarchaeota archaeon TMED132]